MREVFFVRHGPTHAKTMVGWSDLPADLSDTDRIARLAAFLPDDAAVVSSDLIRTRTTAEAIAGNRLRLPEEPELREVHFGAWEMRSWAEIDSETPDHIRAFWETPGEVRPPGGENWDAVRGRVGRAVDRLLITAPQGPLIVVAHFGAILTQVQRAECLTSEEAFSHRIDPLSVTHLSLLPGQSGGAVHRINHAP